MALASVAGSLVGARLGRGLSAGALRQAFAAFHVLLGTAIAVRELSPVVPAPQLATGAVALFGAATSVSYAASGLVDGRLFLALVAGGAVGVAAGVRLAPRLASRVLLARRLCAVMVVATAAYVLWRAWTAGN